MYRLRAFSHPFVSPGRNEGGAKTTHNYEDENAEDDAETVTDSLEYVPFIGI